MHRWSGPRPRPRPVRVRVPPSAVPATRGGPQGRTGRACGSSSGSAVPVRRPDMEAGSSEVGLEDLVPGTDGPARDDAVDHERITGNELLGRLPAREDSHGVTVHWLVHGAGHEQQAAAVELVQSCDVRRTVLAGQRQEVLDGAVGQHVLHAGHRGGPRQGPLADFLRLPGHGRADPCPQSSVPGKARHRIESGAAVMDTAVAPHATTADLRAAATIVLRDVEDLQDADLAGVLDDRLIDGYGYGDAAKALAALVAQTVPTAIRAHELCARAVSLAAR